jgi:hypothetical protein
MKRNRKPGCDASVQRRERTWWETQVGGGTRGVWRRASSTDLGSSALNTTDHAIDDARLGISSDPSLPACSGLAAALDAGTTETMTPAARHPSPPRAAGRGQQAARSVQLRLREGIFFPFLSSFRK